MYAHQTGAGASRINQLILIALSVVRLLLHAAAESGTGLQKTRTSATDR